MAFDWQHFLDSRHVHYVTSGPNVARGHVAVHCPFCGSQDPSQHMSINMSGKGWRCWRNHDHRGKAPARLVQALLGCTWEQAHTIAGSSFAIPNDFLGTVTRLITPPARPVAAKLLLPPEFRSFAERPSARPFLDYLEGKDRGFYRDEVLRFTERYGMYYCTSGWFRYRVLFTVVENGQLVSWTGRSIDKSNPLRYRTLPVQGEEDEDRSDMPSAVGPLPDYLLWFDDLQKSDADTLCLCEGPFDALKVRVLGKGLGIDATCFFTAAPSERQIELLHELLPQYKHRFLLLDRGTLATALKVAGALSALEVIPTEMPANVKDPGLLSSRRELRAMLLDRHRNKA